MRHWSVWVVEFIKLLVRRRPYPLLTQCPICQQTVHLHINRAGRRHAFAHARGLYDGCRLCKHSVGKIKCLGSGALMIFDPRPNEHQRFRLPNSSLKGKVPVQARRGHFQDVRERFLGAIAHALVHRPLFGAILSVGGLSLDFRTRCSWPSPGRPKRLQ
jgi:hypothetical protein